MFNILNQTKLKSPVSAKKLEEIKNKILGKKYNISVVLTNNKESKKLNKKLRNKNKPANVLSFPLEENAGEIFLDLETKDEAIKFDMGYKKYLIYLFIHGCLHLKGYDHGEEMSKLEEKYLKNI
jgi:probable rRNA maturation factor